MQLDLFYEIPLILQIHILAALGALVLGIFLLVWRKGLWVHRILGGAWVAMMATVAFSAVFILETAEGGMPNLYGFSPIHLFVPLVLFSLPRGLWAIYKGERIRHGRTMRGLFFGALIIAGAFTLLPGRFMARMLFGW